MPFQSGNKAAARPRERGPFGRALARAIAQDDGERLRRAAEQLLNLAADGEQWAVRELADRLDGKPDSHVSVTSSRVEEMSLAEIAAEVAALRGGDQPEIGSAAESGGMH